MFTITSLNDLSLNDIAPPVLLDDENITAIIHALDPELQDISDSIKNALLLSRINELDEQALNLLAWQFHVDDYDLSLNAYDATIDMKREAVSNAIKLHMKKGTQWAITEALRQLEIEAEFIPWWQDGAEPYTFKVNADITGDFYITQRRDKIVSSIVRAIKNNKSARSYLSELNITLNDKEDLKHYYAIIPFMEGRGKIPIRYDDVDVIHSPVIECLPFIDGKITIPEQYNNCYVDSGISHGIFMYQNFDLQIGADYVA